MIKRTSTVIWQGSGKEGKGTLTTQSKVLENSQYAYKTRFEEAKGTNPEELIAAAHASCFSMKFAFILAESKYTAEAIETTCTVTLSEGKITKSHLDVKAKIPGISKEDFVTASEKTMNECPVSQALSLEITMDAELTDELILNPIDNQL